jgi:ComF family protein
MNFINKITPILQKCYSICTPFVDSCQICAVAEGVKICDRCAQLLPVINSCCLICAEPLHFGNSVGCGSCKNIKCYYDRIFSSYLYQAPIDKSLLCLKRAKDLSQLELIKNLIYRLSKINILDSWEPDILIPMPMHKSRVVLRGFNQAHEIAKILSKYIGVKVVWDKTFRKTIRKTQFECNLRMRHKNVKQSDFYIDSSLNAEKILIVDDVVTTGASVNAFAQALKMHGVKTVKVWSLCRTAKH